MDFNAAATVPMISNDEIATEPEADNDETALTRDSLSERIYARLRVALMTGQYEPGSRLNIRGLAATYNTSPTPVREAVFQLVREGALEIRLGHQPRVPVLSIPQYLNIRETRAPLERLAAELAAARIDEASIDHLDELHVRFLESEARSRWKDALAANQEFHFTIYRASENDVLVRFIENLWLLAGPFVNNQYPIVRAAVAAVHPHILITDALRRRSPAEVGELVVRDLREGSYNILQKLKNASNAEPRRRRSNKETHS
ncbi:DNA-binding GntR family transcriptional regulator [Neorhizobium galegae]|uniref:GntR family transcriptional regulator n=1 Tax=Neorhizobium galegae TaxID=399 RepID=UPI002782705F|nr:GntR family transcriptional regulator [Neorhizobium galegae]MDQ0138097.1 DNA-binding GntR family transcriptional regulator [Neorhizobium galegae]